MGSSLARKATSTALAVVLATGCFGGVAAATIASDAQPAYAAPAGTWKKSSGKWWYAYSGGSYAESGWAKIGGKWYYFYPDGAMAMSTKIDGHEIGPDGARKDKQ